VRRDGLWHPRLLSILSTAGHGDVVVIADAGLPVPRGVEIVDLLWRRGEPPLLPVVEVVMRECPVEQATIATELADRVLRDHLDRLFEGVPVDEVAHDRLKELTRDAIAVVRTGADIPYANVVLRCGVEF
jgi:D-ribose pyranase